MATHPQGSYHALEWTKWYLTGGAEGEEPSESMKQRLRPLRRSTRRRPIRKSSSTSSSQIHQIAADEFELVGIVTDADRIGIKNKNLRNVPAACPSGWTYPDPGPTLPQQYFYAE